jgi:hypothetical protein
MCLDRDLEIGHLLAARAAFDKAPYMVSSSRPVVSVSLKPFDRSFDSVVSHCGIMIPTNKFELILGYIIFVVRANDIDACGLSFCTVRY